MILVVNLYNVFVYCVLLYYAINLFLKSIFAVKLCPLILVVSLYVVLVYCCTMLCTGVLYMLGLS